MNTNVNAFGLQLLTGEEHVELLGPGGEVLARWVFRDLQARFHQKLRHVLLVHAKAKKINQEEHFHYFRAQFLSGWLFLWHFPRLFSEKLILIDLRVHLKNNRVRNHGTAFRINERNLSELYPIVEEMHM